MEKLKTLKNIAKMGLAAATLTIACESPTGGSTQPKEELYCGKTANQYIVDMNNAMRQDVMNNADARVQAVLDKNPTWKYDEACSTDPYGLTCRTGQGKVRDEHSRAVTKSNSCPQSPIMHDNNNNAVHNGLKVVSWNNAYELGIGQ